MFHRIKNTYWRAAFWAAVIVIPTYKIGVFLMIIFAPRLPESPVAVALIKVAMAGFLLQYPGIKMNEFRGMMFLPDGRFGASVFDVWVPVFSWMFYFFVLLPIFLWRERRAARKQLGETPRTT